MGQRLIIEIRNSNNDVIATQYMHWSAYTGSMFNCFNNLCETLYSRPYIQEEPEFAAFLLRDAFPAAGLTEEACAALGVKETREINRNDGLIDITQEEMDNSIGWGEGTLTVQLEDGAKPESLFYTTDVFWQYEMEEFKDFFDEEKYRVQETEDGSIQLFVIDDDGNEEKIPCYVLDFDGYPDTAEEMNHLQNVYENTEDRGWAFCVQYLTDDKRYFIIQWIG